MNESSVAIEFAECGHVVKRTKNINKFDCYLLFLMGRKILIVN